MSQRPSKYEIGNLIDKRYRVAKILGAGGMAEVYLVEDTEMHNRKIALKLLHSHISLDQVNVERFIREVEITQKHNHPNIVKSYHYGKTDKNEQYFTMEYVEGQSIAEIIKENGKIPYQDVFKYLVQILEGLKVAHSLGIVHRDIKPDNIMLTKDGVIKLSDFGIAKDFNTDIQLTDLDRAPKSYLYKAPELYMEAYDHRVDIYALGISTYEMLTGTTPFTGERNQLLIAHLNKPIPKFAGKGFEIPAFFEEFVERCCAKRKEDRFSSTNEAIEFLENYESYKYANIGRKIKIFLKSKLLKYAIAFMVGYSAYHTYRNLGGYTNGRVTGDALDLVLFDTNIQNRPALESPKDFLIIYIDEKSFEHYGYSTAAAWPRVRMAELFEFLSTKTPKLVIADFRFSKNTQTSTPEIDRRLAEAMSKNPTILSKFLNHAENTGRSHEELLYLDSDDIFKSSAKGVYNANLIPEFQSDSKVRYFNTVKGTLGIPPIYEVLRDNKLCDIGYPTPYDMINYIGPPGTVQNLPFYKVLSDSNFQADEFYNDKIVFIGQQLFLSPNKTQRDAFMTPIDVKEMSGVEIHANTAINIINKNWIRRLPTDYEGLVIALTAVLFTHIMLSINFLFGLLMLFAYSILWLFVSKKLLLSEMFFPGIYLTIFLSISVFPLAALRNYLIKRADEKLLGM